ncbi:hypothetical protein TNCV_2474031 [Trichonephila clavipes]|nr:hypothetical protein TNCV_2474031 [Trichonephila clavipes]
MNLSESKIAVQALLMMEYIKCRCTAFPHVEFFASEWKNHLIDQISVKGKSENITHCSPRPKDYKGPFHQQLQQRGLMRFVLTHSATYAAIQRRRKAWVMWATTHGLAPQS